LFGLALFDLNHAALRRRSSSREFAAEARRRTRWHVFAIALSASLFGSCGHRASVNECEEIIERIARLELEKRMPNDPQGVAREIDDMKKRLRETTMKDCVGKRITESAMRCVRNAKTSKEIVERCFD
jgi:hypothetical protein